MRKVFKRGIAVLLAFALITGNFSNMQVYAENNTAEAQDVEAQDVEAQDVEAQNVVAEENAVEATANDLVAMEGNDSLGSMISDVVQENMENKGPDQPYGINKVTVSDGIAEVVSWGATDSRVVVGIFSDDGRQLLTSGDADVCIETNGDTGLVNTKVELDAQLIPEYFYIRAFLVDSETLRPLSTVFVDNYYTRNVQEFLSKTTADFDEELVYNLDESDNNNFLVFDENTIQIFGDEATNTLVEINDNDLIYVFENPDETVKNLVAGDVFAYRYDTDKLLVVDIDHMVEKEDGSITFYGTKTDLGDVFQYVRIDQSADLSDRVEDEEEAEEDVAQEVQAEEELELEKDLELPMLTSEEIIDKDEEKYYEKTYDLSKAFENEAGASGGISGSVTFKADLHLKIYISKKVQKVSFQVDYSAEFVLDAKVKFEKQHSFAPISIPVLEIVTISLTFGVNLTIEGEIKLTETLTASLGFDFQREKKGLGNEYTCNNLSQSPKFTATLEAELSVRLGISLEVAVSVIGTDQACALQFSISGEIGATVSGKMEQSFTNKEEAEVHICGGKCIQGDVKIDVIIKLNISIAKIGPFALFDKDFTLFKPEPYKLTDWHYSILFNEFGLTPCGHKSVLTTITVTDTSGNPIPSAKITGKFKIKKSMDLVSVPELITDETGKAKGYCADNAITISVSKEGYRSSNSIQLTSNEDTKRVQLSKPKGLVNILAVDEEGNPLTGVTVKGQFENEENGKKYNSVVINKSDGVWIKPAGSQLLEATKPGYETTSTKLGGDEDVIKIQMKKINPVTIAVLDNNSQPLEGAKITGVFATSGLVSEKQKTVTTDANGHATVYLSTNIRVSVEKDGYISKSVVLEKKESTKDIHLEKEKTVSILVTDEDGTPLRSIIIEGSFKENGNDTTRLKTDANGRVDNVVLESLNVFVYRHGKIPQKFLLLGDKSEYVLVISNKVPFELTVVDKEDNPVIGATIEGQMYTSSASDSELVNQVTTDSKGCASFYLDTPQTLKIVADEYEEKIVEISFSDTELKIVLKKCTPVSEFSFYETEDGYGISDYLGSREKVIIPDSYNGKKIVEIGDYAFGSKQNLKEIEIPDSVTSIGWGAFYECTNLTEVKISDGVTTIGDVMFGFCSSLTKIEIPDSVTSIGGGAFYCCESLTEIKIPDSVTAIDVETFENCSSLTKIEIPNSVTSIEDYAFSGCASLAEIEIPDSVTSIGDYAFSGCTSLTEIKIPSSVTTIGKGMFKNCSSLTQIEIPDNVTSIGGNAFGGCTSLTEIKIPDSVTSIGGSAFIGCTSLTEIKIPDSVTEIGEGMFSNCSSLTKIEIPDSVKLIGRYTFSRCTSLAEIEIPDSVWTIRDYAFLGCTSLTKIKIPGVTSIGWEAFGGCTSLTEIKIPDSVTSIGGYAFSGCTSLIEIKIPDSVKLIDGNAFSGCTSLTEIELPDSVTSISGFAFSGCTSLTEIKIPDSVILIGYYAFSGCTSMTEIWIPDSVKFLDANTLENCTSLKSISIANDCKLSGEWDSGLSAAIVRRPAAETLALELEAQNIEPMYFAAASSEENYSCTDTIDETGMHSLSITNLVPGECVNIYVLVSDEVSEPLSATNLLYIEQQMVDTDGNLAFSYIPRYEVENPVIKVVSSTLFDITKAEVSVSELQEDGTEKTVEVNVTYDGTKLIEGRDYLISGVYASAQPGEHVMTITGRGWYEGSMEVIWNLKEHAHIMNGKEEGKEATCTEDGRKEAYLCSFCKLYFEDADGTKQIGTEENLIIPALGHTIKKAEEKVATCTEEGQKEAYYCENCNCYFEDEEAKSLIEQEQLVIPALGHRLTKQEEIPATCTEDGKKSVYLCSTCKEYYEDEYAKKQIEKESDLIIPASGHNPVEVKEQPATCTEAGHKAGVKCGNCGEVFEGLDELPATGHDYQLRSNRRGIKTFQCTKCDDTYTEYEQVLAEDLPDDGIIPTGMWVVGVKDAVYTGKPITQTIRVYDGAILLKQNVDYTVKVVNNINVATKSAKKPPTVIVTGKGNYSGTQKIMFDILPLDISTEETVSVADIIGIVNGKVIKPAPSVYHNGKKLEVKKNYTVEYPDTSVGAYKEAGDYVIRINGKGNYTGNREIVLHLYEDKKLISKVSVSKIASMKYTGEEIRPAIVVKDGKRTILPENNYTLTYENNVEIGTATITITGVGNYVGQKKVTFKIVGTPMSKVKVTGINSLTYNGQAQIPDYFLSKTDGTPLEEGKDYTVSCKNNLNAGKATIIFTGKGQYSGSITRTFSINAFDLSKDSDALYIEENMEAVYAKGGAKPVPVVTFCGNPLVLGKDFTIKYKNNTVANGTKTPTMTIQGKGNFKGKKTIGFTIQKQSLDQVTLNLSDKVYKNAKGNYKATFTLIDKDGKALSSKNDYAAPVYTYEATGERIGANDIVDAGTLVRITLNARENGNYTGSISGVYRIVKSDISKAKVTIVSHEYTAEEICPDKSDITVTVTVGKKKIKLTEDDYEIVGYTNNVKTGTGKVILRGVGNYGGTIKANFKISKKGFSFEEIFAK